MNDITIEDIEQKLRSRIERQKALISVALGYIKSGKPEIAALLLANSEVPASGAGSQEKEGEL